MWKKVIAPTLLVCVIWVVVSCSTTLCIYLLRRSHETILTKNVASIQSVSALQESLWRQQAAFIALLEDDREAQRREFDALEDQFEQSLKAADQSAATAVEGRLVQSIRERFTTYRDFVHHALAQGEGDRPAVADIRDKATQLARGVAESCTAFLQLNERLMTEAVTGEARLERWLYLLRIVFLVTGPLVGIYVGLRTARGFQSSISQISVNLKDASGKLNEEIGSIDVSPSNDPADLSALNQQVQTISVRIRQVLTELHNARHEALRSERLAAVGELAAGIAHEIRNPLTSVKLLIQTAPRNNSTIELQNRHAEVMLQEISRMENTIQALLDFAGPPALRRVVHDLRDTLVRALNLVDGRATHQEVAIVTELGDAPLFVDADPEQIHQVFVNLFINGIESMDWGGRLEIVAGPSDGNPGTCRVVITDSGSGIPDDRLDRIFEPFVTTKERGTGLGLAISRRIINEHGGGILAGNRSEGGATFTVELPLAKALAAATVPLDRRAARAPAGSLTTAGHSQE